MKKIVFGLIALALPLAAIANIVTNSVNAPSFPPVGLTLLATVPAQSGTRQSITVQNQSGDSIQVWRSYTCGTAPIAEIVLSPATIAGGQGSAWSSNTFKGCLVVYGQTGDQVSIWQD